MDVGKGGGKSQIHCPILPRILGLMLFWPDQCFQLLFPEAFRGHRLVCLCS